MENAAYLLAAFLIIWAVLLGYLFILGRRQAVLRREIELLKENTPEED